MGVDEAIDCLAAWCHQSAGTAIEIAPDRELAFASHAVFDDDDIHAVELRMGYNFPPGYRRFMRVVGQSLVFREPQRGTGGMYFFCPEEAINYSLSIWDEEENVGSDRFCFIGWHRSMGDYFGFDIKRGATRNFDVFCHEYPPSDYVSVSDELKSWRTFDEWIIRAVESFGEDTL